MILQALVRYYDILAADETVKISKPGYSQANVSFVLVISKDGELTNIVDLRTDGKKKNSEGNDSTLATKSLWKKSSATFSL